MPSFSVFLIIAAQFILIFIICIVIQYKTNTDNVTVCRKSCLDSTIEYVHLKIQLPTLIIAGLQLT